MLADAGSDITAALDKRPLSESAVRFLAVTAAGLLSLAAWQTQTLQVSTSCAILHPFELDRIPWSSIPRHGPYRARSSFSRSDMHAGFCACV